MNILFSVLALYDSVQDPVDVHLTQPAHEGSNESRELFHNFLNIGFVADDVDICMMRIVRVATLRIAFQVLNRIIYSTTDSP